MASEIGLVGLEDVLAASEILSGVVRCTPVEGSRVLAAAVGGPVHLKCENLQRAGSFKIRGAYVRIARLDPQERAGGVVAASAGNHAQGVALAARLQGAEATIFMPVAAALPKVEATRAYGAEVRLAGDTVDECLESARAFAVESGRVFVHPFDHPDVIAGQGTVGLEIAEQVPDAATVVVPLGGGGLLSGIAVALRALRPDVRIIGVQAETAAAWPASLAAGRPVTVPEPSTIADGIAVGSPGELTFAHVSAFVDEVVTVSDEDISRGLLLCLERGKLVVEPAGIVAYAAVLADPTRFASPVVTVVSGGNIDPLLLLGVIRHGMALAGRYLFFRLRMPDRPGALAGLLEELAAAQANVLDIAHVRTGAQLRVREVEVDVQLETRGAEHCAAVVDRLRRAGYDVDL